MPKECRVRLRPARVEDAEAMLAAMEPEHTQNLQFFHEPLEIERQRAYLARMTKSASDYLFVVLLVADERMVGTVGLHEIDQHNHNARIGKLIFRTEDRAHGYGLEAEELVLRHAVWRLGCHKVYARLLWENTDGQAHYLKLGFKVEGRMREEYFLQGEHHDMVLMSILRREWEARHTSITS